jgi:glutaminyl-peptide cyclotransferase
MIVMRILVLSAALAVVFGCSAGGADVPRNTVNSTANTPAKAGPLPVAGYEIVRSYPHDPRAFTQGLIYHNGFLYESTGQYGESTLRKVEIETGKVLQKASLPKDLFAEGLALLDGKLYQLTWKENTCRVYDINDFRLLQELKYQGEGWGLTTDGTNFFMTDGTHVMRVMRPETFTSVRMLPVMMDSGKPLMQLNELEFVKGEIWANVWHSERPEVLGKPNHIARIDPNNGKLLGWIDLSGISPDDQPKSDNPYDSKGENVLNGIAYDPQGDRIFVTGKQWKRLYEIRLRQPSL